MNHNDRVTKLAKGIDMVYANLYMWPHLTRSQQDKLETLYNDLTFQFVRAKRLKREEVEKEFSKARIAQ
jgi:hypothetical protein